MGLFGCLEHAAEASEAVAVLPVILVVSGVRPCSSSMAVGWWLARQSAEVGRAEEGRGGGKATVVCQGGRGAAWPRAARGIRSGGGVT
jgi:hypothetical protein